MKNYGFTLIEIVVASVLAGLLILILGSAFRTLFRNQSVGDSKESATFPLMAAGEIIERVGRVSRQCKKMGPLGSGEFALECQVDLTRPATNTLTWVRFIRNGTTLEYQRSDDPGATPELFTGPITVIQTFPSVEDSQNGFVLCDSTDMTPVSGVIPCPLEPTEMSSVITNAASPIAEKARFIRYLLRGKGSLMKTTSGDTVVLTVNPVFQGAFFVRNTPLCAPNSNSPCFSW